MPLYPMPRNLSKSQKASFLRKRISDTETLAAKEVTFVEKNYPLFEKKVILLNQMRRKRKNVITTSQEFQRTPLGTLILGQRIWLIR